MHSNLKLANIAYAIFHKYTCNQGRIQDFLKGGSESGVDIEGGANRSIVSLKQGVWGHSPPEAMGYLTLDSTKIPKNARL